MDQREPHVGSLSELRREKNRRERFAWIAVRTAHACDDLIVIARGVDALNVRPKMHYLADCVGDAINTAWEPPEAARNAIGIARLWANGPTSITPNTLWRRLEQLRMGYDADDAVAELARCVLANAWTASCGQRLDIIECLDKVQKFIRGTSLFDTDPVAHPYLIERLAHYLDIPTIQSMWPAAFAAATAGHVDLAMELSDA
jgi:hypothetical protein